MDYITVGIKAFTYVIIFTLVKSIVSKLLGNAKNGKNENGVMCFDKRGISNLCFVIAVFFTFLISFISTLPANIHGITKVIIIACFVIFCLFLYGLSIMYSLWYIKLDANAISKRNYIGRKCEILSVDIERYERMPNGKLILYKDLRKLISIESEYADAVLLWMEKSSVFNRVSKNNNEKMVTVRPAKYHRVLSDISLFVFIFFFMVGVFLKNIVVISLFLCLVLFGVFNCLYHYSEKYVIGNGYIENNNLFKKKKMIPYSDVSKVEIQEGDNVSYLVFYLKTSARPIIKVNTYYENAFALKELAYNKKWIK